MYIQTRSLRLCLLVFTFLIMSLFSISTSLEAAEGSDTCAAMFDIRSTSERIRFSLTQLRDSMAKDGIKVNVWTHEHKKPVLVVNVDPNKINSESFENLLADFRKDPNYRAIKTVNHMVEKEALRLQNNFEGYKKTDKFIKSYIIPTIFASVYLYHYQEITNYLQSFEYLKYNHGYFLFASSLLLSQCLLELASSPIDLTVTVIDSIKRNSLNKDHPNVKELTDEELNLQISNYFKGDLVDQPHPSIIFLHMNQTPDALDKVLRDYELTSFEKIEELNAEKPLSGDETTRD